MKGQDNSKNGSVEQGNSRRSLLKKSLLTAGTIATIGATGAVLEAAFSRKSYAQERSTLPPEQQALSDVIKQAMKTGNVEGAIEAQGRGHITPEQKRVLTEISSQEWKNMAVACDKLEALARTGRPGLAGGT